MEKATVTISFQKCPQIQGSTWERPRVVSCKSAADEISFEWLHHEIFTANSLRAAVQTVCRCVCHNKTLSPFSYTWTGHLAYSLANTNACERRTLHSKSAKVVSRKRHCENWLHLFFFFPRLEKLWWSRKPPRVTYPFLGEFTGLATAVYSDQEEIILCSLEVKMS